MDSSQICSFKEDFGHFMHEGYMQEIHALMAGCLNQPELLQMIPSRMGPKLSSVYFNYIMILEVACPISCSFHLVAFVSCINSTLCHLLSCILLNGVSSVPCFLLVDQILLIKCYSPYISAVTLMQKETRCVYTHFIAD